MDVLTDYSDRLDEVDGRLYVTGVGDKALSHLEKTSRFRATEAIQAYEATPIVLEATRQAYTDAESWLVSLHEEEEEDGTDLGER